MKVLTALRSFRVRGISGWQLATPGAVVVLLLVAGYLGNKVAYVAIRDAIFTDYSADAGALYGDPPSLENGGYRTDPVKARRAGRQELEAAVGAGSLAQLEALGDDTERAKGLARLVARHPAAPRTGCGFTDNLSDKARELAMGRRGCCSDFTQMFVALASAIGMPAREITSNSHGFNEFYDRRLKKWVFIDAQFAFIVRDHDHAPLSALGFRDAVLHDVPHRLEFFQDAALATPNRAAIERNSYQTPSGEVQLADIRYYSSEGLAMLAFPWGNNVFEATEQNLRLRALPKPAARLVSHLSGVRPNYVALADGPARAEIWKRRLVAFGFYASLVLLAGWVLQLLMAWRRGALGAANGSRRKPSEPADADARLSTAPPRG